MLSKNKTVYEEKMLQPILSMMVYCLCQGNMECYCSFSISGMKHWTSISTDPSVLDHSYIWMKSNDTDGIQILTDGELVSTSYFLDCTQVNLVHALGKLPATTDNHFNNLSNKEKFLANHILLIPVIDKGATEK
jgi:hypothetical protein